MSKVNVSDIMQKMSILQDGDRAKVTDLIGKYNKYNSELTKPEKHVHRDLRIREDRFQANASKEYFEKKQETNKAQIKTNKKRRKSLKERIRDLGKRISKAKHDRSFTPLFSSEAKEAKNNIRSLKKDRKDTKHQLASAELELEELKQDKKNIAYTLKQIEVTKAETEKKRDEVAKQLQDISKSLVVQQRAMTTMTRLKKVLEKADINNPNFPKELITYYNEHKNDKPSLEKPIQAVPPLIMAQIEKHFAIITVDKAKSTITGLHNDVAISFGKHFTSSKQMLEKAIKGAKTLGNKVAGLLAPPAQPDIGDR